MKHLSLLLITTIVIVLTACSKDGTPEPNAIQFDDFVNKILGYHRIGQEDTWLNQNEAILNIYEDALTFSGNDSLSVAYIGFGYGNIDLSHYKVTRSNYALWEIIGADLVLKLTDGTSQTWKILETNNEFITFQQEATQATFSMKIMD